MRPLMAAAFYSGLCPIGQPPSYKPGWRAITYGVVINTTIFVCILWFLGREVFTAYQIEITTDLDVDASDENDTFFGYEEIGTVREPLNTTAAPAPAESPQSTLSRVLIVSSSAGLIVANLGLFIGYFRKMEHLAVVFRMSDKLPGKAHWKTALFVVELSVYTVPATAWAVRSYFASKGMLHVDAFACIGMLVTVEKFMILHLVARVGMGFDVVNRRLEALGGTLGAMGEDSPSVGPTQASCSSIVDTIIDLRQLHMDICELLERVVRAYEVQILAILICEFVTAVLTIYVEARNLYTYQLAPMDLLTILFLLLITQVTTLVYGTCRSTSGKGNAASTIVHKHLNSGRFQEEEVQQQLMIFSMQLAHKEVSVSPYDVVTLDYSLLQAMGASVAMHIVILIQFNLSS